MAYERLSHQMKRKIVHWAKDRLGMFDYTKGWIKGHCPECGKLKYGLHIGKNMTHCFRCEFICSPIELVMKVEGFDTVPQAQSHLNLFEGADYLETPMDFLPDDKKTELPKGYKLILLGQGGWGKRARKYLKGRGFNINDLALKGVGYCTNGEHKGRIIIPFFERGKLIYFNSRQFIGGNQKFKNPRVEDFGIGKSMLLYNVDCLEMYEHVFIMESATNAMTWGDDAIGAGGKVFSNYQISKLLESPVKKFTIILDPDAYGYAVKLAERLYPHKQVRVVNLPEKVYLRSKKKTVTSDVNALGKTITKRYVDNTSWINQLELNRLKFDAQRTQLTYY
jgi:hypothetical protein